MRLIKLEMLNIASLQGKNEINFEDGILKDCQIFSIVGPTGSGKSSILDAICLALYGRAPRYDSRTKDGKITNNQSKINVIGEAEDTESNRLAPTDPRNIMTKDQKECYSKLTFLANNGNTYRAEWSVRFKRTCYDKAETRLYRIDLDGTEHVDQGNILDIIGLDFDQFLRTVLIAQGSFAGFLKADEEERYQLLEKLVGNGEIYKKIAEAVKNRKSDAERKYNELNATCGARQNDVKNEEELTALNNQIKELSDYQNQHKAKADQLKEGIKWYEENRKRQKDVEDAKKAMDQANEAYNLMTNQFLQLALYDATHEVVNTYNEQVRAREELTSKTAEAKRLETQIAQTNVTIATEEEALKSLNAKAKSTEDMLAQQRPHINKARTLQSEVNAANKAFVDQQTALRSAEMAKTNADNAVTANTNAIKTATAALQAAEENLGKQQQAIEQKKKNLQNAVETSKKALEDEQKKNAGKDAKSLQQVKDKVQQENTDIEAAIRIQNDLTNKTNEKTTLEARQKVLTDRNNELAGLLATLTIEEITKDVEALKRAHTLMTSHDWNTNRDLLQEDKPCPLCGAVHHPYADKTNYTNASNTLSQELQEKQKELKTQTENKTKWEKEQSTNIGEFNGNTTKLTALDNDINYLNRDWNTIHTAHPTWETDKVALEKKKVDIQQRLEAANKALKEYNDIVAKVQELQKEYNIAQTNLSNFDTAKELEAVTKARNDANTKLETEKGKTPNLLDQQKIAIRSYEDTKNKCAQLESELKEKQDKLAAEIGGKDPDQYEKELQDAVNQANTAVETKKEHITKLQTEKGTHEGAQKQLNDAIEQLGKRITNLSTTISAWLDAYNANPKRLHELQLTDIEVIAKSQTDWENVRAIQSQLKTATDTTSQTHKDCDNAWKQHQETKPKDEEDSLSQQQKDHESLSKETELIDAKTTLRKHEDAVKDLGLLTQQLQQASEYFADCKELFDAVGSEGKFLRKIAQCYTLRFLIDQANAQIMQFKGRYQLSQVPNSLGMRVIDKERFDELRETTSLSGGETFIVSLGLALGLSSLASRHTSFEDLFVDEGFGTLDPETLSVVIDALSRINVSQGKKVGVISHTDTMSEQITTQIQVIPNKDGTSRISVNNKI